MKYSKEGLLTALKKRSEFVAGKITEAFFDSVAKSLPPDEEHVFETFGAALTKTGLPEVADTASQMLSRGSGDTLAASMGYGNSKSLTKGFSVTVGTSVGFVGKLEDGRTITPGDMSGNKGRKEPGTEGQLYGPRTDYGQGFLMWEDVGGRSYALSVNWGPQGFFEKAREAADEMAQKLGAM